MKVYIVAAKRTAIGKFLGSLAGFGAGELGAMVIKNILQETGVEASSIDRTNTGGNRSEADYFQRIKING